MQLTDTSGSAFDKVALDVVGSLAQSKRKHIYFNYLGSINKILADRLSRKYHINRHSERANIMFNM